MLTCSAMLMCIHAILIDWIVFMYSITRLKSVEVTTFDEFLHLIKLYKLQCWPICMYIYTMECMSLAR